MYINKDKKKTERKSLKGVCSILRKKFLMTLVFWLVDVYVYVYISVGKIQ